MYLHAYPQIARTVKKYRPENMALFSENAGFFKDLLREYQALLMEYNEQS